MRKGFKPSESNDAGLEEADLADNIDTVPNGFKVKVLKNTAIMEAAEASKTKQDQQEEDGEDGAYDSFYSQHPMYVFFAFIFSSFLPPSTLLHLSHDPTLLQSTLPRSHSYHIIHNPATPPITITNNQKITTN